MFGKGSYLKLNEGGLRRGAHCILDSELRLSAETGGLAPSSTGPLTDLVQGVSTMASSLNTVTNTTTASVFNYAAGLHGSSYEYRTGDSAAAERINNNETIVAC